MRQSVNYLVLLIAKHSIEFLKALHYAASPIETGQKWYCGEYSNLESGHIAQLLLQVYHNMELTTQCIILGHLTTLHTVSYVQFVHFIPINVYKTIVDRNWAEVVLWQIQSAVIYTLNNSTSRCTQLCAVYNLG